MKSQFRTLGLLALTGVCALAVGSLLPAQAPHQAVAEEILEATGVKGGLVVHLGCGDGKLAAALCVSDSYLVHGLDPSPRNIERAREHIRSLDLYGRVSVEQWKGRHLPYTDNLVNLVVSEKLGKVSMDEVLRVLAPNGAAYIKKGRKWTKTVKPWPGEIDEWTHYLHDASNNAVARDSVVGPPRHMQWVAKPLYCRSHEIDSSISALVSAQGRLFYILDEGLTGITDERLPPQWSLVARDAFNGVLLWKRPLPGWGWQEWKKEDLAGKDWTTLRGQRTRSPIVLPRRLVAEGDRVYVTLGYRAPVTVLDAATGEHVRQYEGTEGADEMLLSQGMLLLCIRGVAPEGAGTPSAEAAPESILAIKADTGEAVWRESSERIVPLCVAVEGERVFFHSGKEIVCLSLSKGGELWRAASDAGRGSLWGGTGTLVAYQGAVLFLGPKGFQALSAESGEEVWSGPGRRGAGVANPPDIFVADGLVWYGGLEGERDRMTTRVIKSGHDPMTGEVKRTVEVPHLISPLHHFRCYRSKATERYLLWPKRGVEFLDLRADNHMKHDWLRAPCKYGCLPCNGLLYVPPHQCFCYPAAKLSGFNALAAGLQVRGGRPGAQAGRRLERGDAYNATIGTPPAPRADDWPTYRHDAKRSGSTASAVPTALNQLWEAELGAKITAPVVADGRLLVASVDTHAVHARDARSGEPMWHYTAGGRVDSPPTVYQGLVLFGSADGWVYCLRASDGRLVWRFRAGPEDRRVGAFGQLESPWPVHGSVLVQDDPSMDSGQAVAYFAAGRSSYLDGGIRVYGLDPATGKVLHEARVEGPYPDVTKDVGRPFDMEGARPEVLVGDGDAIYMRQVKFDSSLVEQEIPRITKMGDRKVGLHVFATGGLLDDSWWNRTYWMYTETWPGFYMGNQASKAGQLLVFDDTTTYGVKCYTKRNVHSPMFFPATEGYLLFADDNGNEPVLEDNARDKDKGPGFTRAQPAKWSVSVPVRIRAMVLAGQTLFAAGPPDVLDPDDPLAAFEGRKGGALLAVSCADGTGLAEYKLESPPVFDGMIAANERLYLATTDGKVLCFGGA